MNDRGFTLVDAILSIAIMSIVCASAMRVVLTLPGQNVRWQDAAESRQRLRVVDARGAQLTANAGPIALDVGGVIARVPSIWPRRLGLLRPDAAADVSASAVTFLARVDAQRQLTLTESLNAGGGDVSVALEPGCGSRAACGLAQGDAVLVVSSASAGGLYRIAAIGARLRLDALTSGGSGFAPGAVMVPVSISTLYFDADEGSVRIYDGYRSDNVLVDGVQGLHIALAAAPSPVFAAQEWGGAFADESGVWRGTGHLDDGPYVGTGALAFDVDHLALHGLTLTLTLTSQGDVPASTASLTWRAPAWR